MNTSALNNSVIISLLGQCWRWSVFLMFPLLLVLYVQFSGVGFADFDNGINQHKWQIILIYLLYVLLWLRFNRHVKALLEQRRR
ncbi:hypothetical protein CBP31_09325 [Oceanisphaera profunda]|uniref:Uncharacterized protein n=1 Tax=Oceanisphaera profunda TaxID=1416627 RepID=A0A1Y0D674_9GAMM|nr:hypothetical protein [Oceanisphaera profunda]ART82804.1 hypothetical protein CBP31_09325 [Oceanisphaera profunda]